MPPFQNIALLGLPFDRYSSYLQGAALAPDAIRQQLHCGSANYYTELGFDFQDPRISDCGNLPIAQYEDIEHGVAALLKKGFRTLSLGGDHSVTYPILKAYARFFPVIHILHIDAHGDLYDQYEGNPHSHACPFARIMEAGLAQRLVQVGIRALNPHQRAQITRFGVETIEMKDFHQTPMPVFTAPVYLSLDLDGLDPAFAPGVSHHEPGGLTTREVLNLIHRRDAPILGADIVELNPHRDVSFQTAALAAKLLKEIAGKMVAQWSGEFIPQ